MAQFPTEKPVFGYLTHLEQGKFKHFPAKKFEVVTGPFIDINTLIKVEAVWTRTFKNIPHFEGSSNIPTLMNKATVEQFFPSQNLKTDFTVQKNLCKTMQLHIDTSGEQQF